MAVMKTSDLDNAAGRSSLIKPLKNLNFSHSKPKFSNLTFSRLYMCQYNQSQGGGCNQNAQSQNQYKSLRF
jgi:hypothetical protein